MYNFKLQLLAYKDLLIECLKGNYQRNYKYENKGTR